jgi:hypothetical protein
LVNKFVTTTSKYLFTVNPYDNIEYDEAFIKFSEDMLSTLNKNVILDFGEIDNNIIYLVLAEDLLNSIRDRSAEYINASVKLYYPFLFNKSISTLNELMDNKIKLMDDTSKTITESFIKNVKIIDLMNEMNEDEDSLVNYNNDGIKLIELTMYQTNTFTIPIDAIFKFLHTNASLPFTKLTINNRDDKLLRLYAPNTAVSGNKLPYLNKATISKLILKIIKENSIGVYIVFEEGSCIIEIFSNSKINLNLKLDKVISMKK